jgi:regulator of protease activity HflC (stomatin/prohibitin superfamily)
MSEAVRNKYLDEVMQGQVELEQNLKRRAAPAVALAAPARRAFGAQGEVAPSTVPSSNGVDVRVTGWRPWRTVVVPPNAYVVHTRRGHDEPLHLGLGISFRFDRRRDAYLVVPGTMQTILINARCICRERQGILVQGYVQWIIQDFATAYRTLGFSDANDPMRIVTLQLREQAEATIKDKVATMSIDDVLADKQPIIEELTARLRGLAEGADLRVATVQIKEAVVSSARLWESLQRPFRAERARIARLAEVEADEQVSARELAATQARDAARLEADDATERKRIALERARQEAVAELERIQAEAAAAIEKLRLEAELARERARAEAEHAKAELALALDERRQRIQNELSAAALEARMSAALPDIVGKLPHPEKLYSVTVAGAPELTTALRTVAEAVRRR